MSKFTRKSLADVAEIEAAKHLVWTPGSEADKFKKKFWPVFGKGKWSWCAATVTWCCEEAGLTMPVNCPGKFGYTFALVEAWQQWAEEQGLYIDNDGRFKPERGDITLFDWSQTNINDADTDYENHIGVFLYMDGSLFVCAEGNTNNQTNLKERHAVNIQGFIRIPDGYDFPQSGDVRGTPGPVLDKPSESVRFGDRGESVKRVQAALLNFRERFNPGKVDGVFGDKTRDAITEFQRSNKLPLTGFADPATLKVL